MFFAASRAARPQSRLIVIIKADWTKIVSESAEKNNTLSFTFTVKK